MGGLPGFVPTETHLIARGVWASRRLQPDMTMWVDRKASVTSLVPGSVIQRHRGSKIPPHVSYLSLLRPPTASFTSILSASRSSSFLIGNDRGSPFKISDVSFDDHPPLARNHWQARVVSELAAKTDHDVSSNLSSPIDQYPIFRSPSLVTGSRVHLYRVGPSLSTLVLALQDALECCYLRPALK
jgi:hypothetical protein